MNVKDRQGKLIYRLERDLAENPEEITETQEMTLDTSRPYMGLSGENGLFGSKEWWQSIEEGRIEVRTYTGSIQRLYIAGQDFDEDEPKDFEYLSEDGQIRRESCIANDDMDLDLYQVGATVTMSYALDRLKDQPAKDGGTNYSKILLEVWIS